MKGFQLDKSGDVAMGALDNEGIAHNSAGCRIRMIDGNALLTQTVQTVIATNKGEWAFQKNEGISFKNLLGKNVDEEMMKNEVFQGLLQVDNSFALTKFSTELDKETRKVVIHFTAVNGGGKEVEGVSTWA